MRSAAAGAPVPMAVQRLRLVCVGLALALLTFSQSSGLEAADTKLDLVVAPARFLRRSLVMWDPTAAAGQLQDQAYGYLFPMGPFFLLGKLSALSPWVVQRSWESLLLIAAFLGIVRLSRLLGVLGFWPRVGAGLAYALAPRMLMELGVISSELLPVVALPWVLIPLVRGATDGPPRRAAARSGIALLFAGGINAAATLAILPVPALWLLTRSRGPRRRALMTWWALAVVLSCLWWVVPLVVLGRYSPPFLDWIESSAVTTSRTSLIAVLRGVDHWQAYLGPGVWPAGWIFVAGGAAVLATAAVAALGLAGLGHRAPHRGFLLACLFVGLALVTLGHVADVGPPFAGTVRNWLDGPLNAFRNVHKFDPIVRLPLAIGVGHSLAAIAARLPERATLRLRDQPLTAYPRMLVSLALIGVAAVAITPALGGDLVPGTRAINDPVWWHQTGSWLGDHEGSGRALVVPGAAQPAYVWGRPRDDALQPVAGGPWAVRDVAPLGQPGYIRLLDAVEAMLAAGQPAPELGPLLSRAGIRYLVVRNDLDTSRSGATPLRYVHATVDTSPGWAKVAEFGGAQTAPDDPARLVDLGLTSARAAVEIYENASWAGVTALLPADGAIVANGSSDALPQLLSAGVTNTTPVLFGAEPAALRQAGGTVRTVLTDGIRKREFGFGAVNRYSATMTADQRYAQQRAAHDYLPSDADSLSTMTYRGISDVRASSSASTVGPLFTSAADGPWAALDADASTAWRSASFSGAVGQWLEVDLRAPSDISTARLAFAAGNGSYPSRVLVTTDAGSLAQDVVPDSAGQVIRLPAGPTQSVRITVLAVADDTRGVRVGVSTFQLAGVLASRALQIPGATSPDLINFQVTSGRRSPCLSVQGAAACDQTWRAAGEEDTALDRRFTLAARGTYQLSAGVRLVAGPQLDVLLDAGNPIRTLASSNDSADPRERAGAAVDGDLRTGWVAKAGDRSPTIALEFTSRRTVDGLTVLPIRGAPTSAPTTVLVHAGGEVFSGSLDDGGVVRFPHAVRTDSVTVTVMSSTLRVSTDSVTGLVRQLPLGIGEIRLRGPGAPIGQAAARVSIGCDQVSPPALDGALVPMRVQAAAADVLAGRAVQAESCNPAGISLGSGAHDVRLAASDLLAPDSLTFVRSGEPAAGEARGSAGTLDVQSWSATDRAVRVTATQAALFVVRENANAGWRATLGGATLAPITVDGWEQGWLVPAGAEGVIHLWYLPQRSVDIGLIAGGVAVGVLICGALISGRGRRSTGGALSDATVPGALIAAAAVLALGAIGGWAGAIVGIVALVVSRRFRKRVRVRAWLAGAVLLAAGLATASSAGSAHPVAESRGAQLACLVALALLIVARPYRTAPWAAEAAQQRAFEEVPRGGGDGGGGEGGKAE